MDKHILDRLQISPSTNETSTSKNVASVVHLINVCILLWFFLPSVSRIPRGLEKKLEENCRSDHYSGQSSNTKESCSSTLLNRCTSMETRWNYYDYYDYYLLLLLLFCDVCHCLTLGYCSLQLLIFTAKSTMWPYHIGLIYNSPSVIKYKL